jgi:hypothetical protein
MSIISLLHESGFELHPSCYKCKKSEAIYHYAPYNNICIITNTLKELKNAKEKENLFGIDSCISLLCSSYKYDSFDDDNINKIIGWYMMRLNNNGIPIYCCIYLFDKQIKKFCIIE